MGFYLERFSAPVEIAQLSLAAKRTTIPLASNVYKVYIALAIHSYVVSHLVIIICDVLLFSSMIESRSVILEKHVIIFCEIGTSACG